MSIAHEKALKTNRKPNLNSKPTGRGWKWCTFSDVRGHGDMFRAWHQTGSHVVTDFYISGVW